MSDKKIQPRIGELVKMRAMVAELLTRVNGRMEKLGHVGQKLERRQYAPCTPPTGSAPVIGEDSPPLQYSSRQPCVIA
jgi:hypothetical protein